MYTVEFLKKIPYFEEYHQTESNFSLEENLENIIDSLTGLISRKYIIGYANYLIKVKSPFRLAIIDLDNFKQINDNYGHTNGDKVLQTTASDLRKNVSDKGLCGRFGGDEYLLVINGLLVYDEIYEFIRKMFQTPKDGSCSNAFRKSLKFSDFQPFITATLGVAQYPTDADNYSDLFLCADKALYRGKMKGRNCYIIYLKDKHEGIDISALKKKSTLDAITRLTHFTSNTCGTVHNKIKRNVEFLREFISAAGTCYIEKNGHCKDLNVDFLPEEIDELLDFNNQFFCNQRSAIMDNTIFPKIKAVGISAFIVQKCVFNNTSYGYIIIYDNEIQHIWQEEDLLVSYCAAHLIGELKFLNELNK